MAEDVNEKYYRYLDALRESGAINMLGAAGHLDRAFRELNMSKARKILAQWMETYSERHPQGSN